MSENSSKKTPVISSIPDYNDKSLQINEDIKKNPVINKIKENIFFKDQLFMNHDSNFFPNQDVELNHFDDSLELKILQTNSTPGLRTESILVMPPGIYDVEIFGTTEVANVFFPWIIDVDTGIRLSETTHFQGESASVKIPLFINEEKNIYIGVLAHNMEINDSFYLQGISITKSDPLHYVSTSKGFQTVHPSKFLSHNLSKLSLSRTGLLVKAPIGSTSGAYSIVKVNPNETISIKIRAHIYFPSIAFLYVADANSKIELTKRRDVLRSFEDKSTTIQELNTFIKIPANTSHIRIGLLFSSFSTAKNHEMLIENLEVTEYVNLMDVVDECYVLNLEKDKSKMILCDRQAFRFGWNIKRWEASNGYSEFNRKEWMNYVNKPYTQEEINLNRKAIDSPGAWGYLLSMKELFKDAISKNYDSIAVFDDDFIVSDTFDHGFSRLIKSVGDDWEVIYLGASQWSWDNVDISSRPFYLPTNNTNGSFAIIYANSVFNKLLSRIELMLSPFDSGALRDIVTSTSIGKSFVAFPNLVIANVEKVGIRASRSQSEYARRFRWDLTQFPQNFVNWSPETRILKDLIPQNIGSLGPNTKNYFITGVTTYNRKKYIENFIEKWIESIDFNDNNVLIVADDGSSDGTTEFLRKYEINNNFRFVVLQNDSTGIARQSNSILKFITNQYPNPDMIFMCNDDIEFIKKGWQKKYFDISKSSGFDHLVYFDELWKSAKFVIKHKKLPLISSCNARDAMGCFYTVTPKMIQNIGYFDEESFPIRGHSHIDFTLRACRAKFNELDNLYDIKDSNKYIRMIQREGYISTNRIYSKNELSLLRSKENLDIRENFLSDKNRIKL